VCVCVNEVTDFHAAWHSIMQLRATAHLYFLIPYYQ